MFYDKIGGEESGRKDRRTKQGGGDECGDVCIPQARDYHTCFL